MPLHQTDKNHGDSKVQFLQLQHGFRNYNEHNPSHVRWHMLPSQPSQLLKTPFRLLTMSLAAPKANPIFHAANKNLFIKKKKAAKNLLQNCDLVKEQQPSDTTIQPLQHAALRTLSIPTWKKKQRNIEKFSIFPQT